MSTTDTITDAERAAFNERQELLELMRAHKVTVDPDTSLEGLRELHATFGPNAAAENAKMVLAPEELKA